jgi:uncharacterized protein (TIGR00369 family)
VSGADIPVVDDRRTARARAREEHDRVLAAGRHLLQQLTFRDVEVNGADLAIDLDLGPTVTNPRGALQGGIMATLVDIVAGRAVLLDGPRDGVATTDLSIHYLRGLTVGPARAVATVVRRGRSLAVVTVDVIDVGTGELCAVSTVAFSVSPAAAAAAVPDQVS